MLPAGCATWIEPSDAGDESLRLRATTEIAREVRLSVTVLGSDDSVRFFGVDVNATGVQPVWLEVVNHTTHMLWLLRSGLDPDYFSPREVAWSAHVTFGGKTNDRIDEHFERLAFQNPIPPGGTRSGMLFTNPQPVTKLLNVDLLGDEMMIPFTLFVPVPGGPREDYQQYIYPYADSELTYCYDEAALRRSIEALPCCATSSSAAAGDPINVVLVGRLADIGAALVRRGYRRELTSPETGQRVFGRAPGFVLRKRAQAGAPANWLRLWRAPIAYGDQMVLVAQAGRPVGGRFAAQADREHLDSDVDEVRDSLIQDLLYSGGLEKFGFAAGVGAMSAQPRASVEKVRYRTDGLRAVLLFATRPLSLDDVEVLDWQSLTHSAAPPGE